MQLKLSTPLAFLAATLTLANNVAPAYATPAGTTDLKEWFQAFIPVIFPNTTTNWQTPFEDGTLDRNIKGTFNAETFTNRAQMRAFWTAINSRIVSRLDYYIIEPTAEVAFSTDEEGKNGWVIATAKTRLRTKEGDVYEDGEASAFATVKWNEQLGKRTFTEWKEVNTPPNYPNYPWN